MDVCAYDPYPDHEFCAQNGVRLLPLDELFSTCDVISVHAPLMPSTKHIVNAEALAFPLFELENVLLTPHIAGYSSDGIASMGMMGAESILAALQGRVPQHVVNKELIAPLGV
jgi:phosphoglycerate dehydrogenase-like enzyme